MGLTPRRCRDARRQLRRRGSVGYREPVHPEGYLPLAAESPRLHATQNRVSTPNRPRLRGLQSRRSTAPNGRVSFFVLSGDRNNKQTHPETPRAAEASRRRRRRYWLEHEGREIELGSGSIVIGRSSTCQIVVDDGLVSRRHAKVSADADGVYVEDLGSVNGVFVNARRIQGTQQLGDGDHLQIGRQDFVLRSALVSERPVSYEAPTIVGVPEPSSRPPVALPAESEVTFSGDTLDLLGGVAEKTLALGRGDEAERILSGALLGVLSEVRSRKGADASPETLGKAARYAVRLAEATGKGRWIDFVIELYDAAKRPLAADMVDHLYVVLRRTSPINLGGLRAYLATLRSHQASFGPSERFVLQRLEGLERLAASM